MCVQLKGGILCGCIGFELSDDDIFKAARDSGRCQALEIWVFTPPRLVSLLQLLLLFDLQLEMAR